jgi:cytoskeletal protein CcmA (bactofilin family)
MGLFGRDERSEGRKPSSAEAPQRPRSETGATAVTLISKSSHIEGVIRGAGEVRIEGVVTGKIDCSASVVVADGGRVDAELRAETVTIAGTVKGNVVAGQKIELTPTAKVEGDITSPRILIREGANFEGQINMTDGKKRPQGEPSKKSDQLPSASAKGD